MGGLEAQGRWWLGENWEELKTSGDGGWARGVESAAELGRDEASGDREWLKVAWILAKP